MCDRSTNKSRKDLSHSVQIQKETRGLWFLQASETDPEANPTVNNETRYLAQLPEEMSKNFFEAVGLISKKYDGDSANIWREQPSSAELVYRFHEFRGIGQKIGTMAANILVRDFKIQLRDYYSIDVSIDIQVRRVLARLGLVEPDDSIERIVYRARALHPEFPGLLDYPAWEIGRNWCRSRKPLCGNCYMKTACPSWAKIANNGFQATPSPRLGGPLREIFKVRCTYIQNRKEERK